MDTLWFDTWSGLARILLVGAAAYVALLLVLRVSGKRTLAKLNAFDFVVTVALGSTLASVLLDNSVAWAEGATALALLAGLQFVVAFLTTRAPWMRSLVTAEPTILLRNGSMVEGALRRQRVSEAQVRQAVRGTGSGGLEDVALVLLETDGTLSVIAADRLGSGSAVGASLED